MRRKVAATAFRPHSVNLCDRGIPFALQTSLSPDLSSRNGNHLLNVGVYYAQLGPHLSCFSLDRRVVWLWGYRGRCSIDRENFILFVFGSVRSESNSQRHARTKRCVVRIYLAGYLLDLIRKTGDI